MMNIIRWPKFEIAELVVPYKHNNLLCVFYKEWDELTGISKIVHTLKNTLNHFTRGVFPWIYIFTYKFIEDMWTRCYISKLTDVSYERRCIKYIFGHVLHYGIKNSSYLTCWSYWLKRNSNMLMAVEQVNLLLFSLLPINITSKNMWIVFVCWLMSSRRRGDKVFKRFNVC